MLVGERNGREYPIADDRPVQEFFLEAWQAHGSSSEVRRLVEIVLGHSSFWGQNLTTVPDLVEEVAGHLIAIERQGIVSALRAVA
jgi:tagaturonate reductase